MTHIRRIKASEDAEQFTKRIKKIHGFKLLGSGAYANVYINKSLDAHKVLKVGMIGDHPRDDGWLQYAIACMKKTPRNPWLPRIYDLRICKHSKKAAYELEAWGYYVAKMERLHKVKYSEGSDIADELEEALSIFSADKDDWDDKFKVPSFYALPIEPAVRLVGDKNLIAALELISKVISNHHEENFETDLHDENIMQREDGHTVIIDPIQ